MRFRQRHVHKTLVDYVVAELTDKGWVEDPVNFGVTPVTFVTAVPEFGGTTIARNTVAITLGDEPEDRDEELGGGLISCDFVLFVDVFGEDASTAVSIASDLKDSLKHKKLPVRDYTSNPAGDVTTATLELEDVMIETPPVATTNVDKRFWRVVKAMAIYYALD
jgi:hypothetical protein